MATFAQPVKQNRPKKKKRRPTYSSWSTRLAPQVRFELTTLRLTAECSAVELLRNIGNTALLQCFHGIRRRPSLPGRYQPSTFGAWRLNCCVRDGNRWVPPAIATGNCISLSRAEGLPSGGCSRSRSPHRLSPLLKASSLTVRVRFGLFPLLRFRLSALACFGFRLRSLPAFALTRFLRLRMRPPHPENCTGKVDLESASLDQALDRLVSTSFTRCRAFTVDLSTLWSSRGLTCF